MKNKNLKMEKKLKECQWCGQWFNPNDENKWFCSKPCKNKIVLLVGILAVFVMIYLATWRSL